MQERQELQSNKQGKVGKRLNKDVVNSGGERCLNPLLLEQSIIQSLPTGVIVFGPDLKIIQANPEAVKLIELDDYIDKTLANGTDSFGSSGRDWTGQLKAVISTGKTRKFDSVTYRSSKGEGARLLRIICIPLLYSDESLTKDFGSVNHPEQVKAQDNVIEENQRHPGTEGFGGAVIIEDVTEEVNIQRRLSSAEKLATVGKVASKVAHELNNPMDGILRYVNLALRIVEREKLEKPKEYLEQCRQGLMRMVHIISELLEFSRSTYALTEEYVRIEQIIEDAIKTMDMRAEASNIRVERDYRPGIPQIRSGNLFQVFYNLIKNALDAMPNGGQLSISTSLASDNNIVVEFSDTGRGFASEDADAIFEPFFTTKDEGKGTGLGLAICKDIIERCHGRITAENAPGGGSIFTVYLPMTSENS